MLLFGLGLWVLWSSFLFYKILFFEEFYGDNENYCLTDTNNHNPQIIIKFYYQIHFINFYIYINFIFSTAI